MRQHKLALCARHFSQWFAEQTAHTIHKYKMLTPGDRILVAVSGGKDSLALWDVLLKLGYHTDGLYIDLGIDGDLAYSAQSKQKAVAFADARPTANLIVVDIPGLYAASIIDVARRRRRSNRPCSICGTVKRHEMNRVALEGGYDILATGHNLDDEAATLFGNVLHWQSGYLQRQSPVLPANGQGLARKVKPFCRFYERETAAYALIEGIDYIADECPFATGATSLAHKQTLAQMEHDSPGTKMHFYANFLRAKAEGLFCPPDVTAQDLHPCAKCGQPTTAPDLCSFCRLWEPVPSVPSKNR